MPSYSLVMKREVKLHASIQRPQNIHRPISILPLTIDHLLDTNLREEPYLSPESFHRTACFTVSKIEDFSIPPGFGGASWAVTSSKSSEACAIFQLIPLLVVQLPVQLRILPSRPQRNPKHQLAILSSCANSRLDIHLRTFCMPYKFPQMTPILPLY